MSFDAESYLNSLEPIGWKLGLDRMELLSTEQNFLEALEIVRDIFINPIRDSKLLDRSEIETIFINWNDLIVCSIRLCK